MKRYLINAFGEDRPGLVAKITKKLFNSKANLGDLQMTRLGGIFALLLEFFIDQSQQAKVRTKLQQLATDESLKISMIDADPYGTEYSEQDPNMIITLYGADRPGIVYEITRVLGQQKVNIINLETRLEETSTLYLMVMELHKPDTVDKNQLTEQLEKTAEDIGTTIRIRPFDPPEL